MSGVAQMAKVKHACPRCGHIAHRSVWMHADGVYRPKSCSICVKIASAEKHETMARKLRFDAATMCAKRKAKKGAP